MIGGLFVGLPRGSPTSAEERSTRVRSARRTWTSCRQRLTERARSQLNCVTYPRVRKLLGMVSAFALAIADTRAGPAIATAFFLRRPLGAGHTDESTAVYRSGFINLCKAASTVYGQNRRLLMNPMLETSTGRARRGGLSRGSHRLMFDRPPRDTVAAPLSSSRSEAPNSASGVQLKP